MFGICGDDSVSFWWHPVPNLPPNFTQCARLSLLAWVPACFFWLLCPAFGLQLWRVHKRGGTRRPLPLSWLLLAKFGLCTLLMILAAANFFTVLDNPNGILGQHPWSAVTAPLIRLLNMFSLFVALRLAQLFGLVSSGILHISWLVHFLCSLPDLYAGYQNSFTDHSEPYCSSSSSASSPTANCFSSFASLLLELLLPLCWSLSLFIQCLLFCFADPRRIFPYATNTDGQEQIPSSGQSLLALSGHSSSAPTANDDAQLTHPMSPINRKRASPELDSSFLCRLTFFWFRTLPTLGRQRDLTFDDLYVLNEGSRAEFLVPQWERSWLPAVQRFYEKKREQLTQGLRQALLEGKKKAKNASSATKDEKLAPVKQQLEAFEDAIFASSQKPLRDTMKKKTHSPKEPSLVYALYKIFKWELLSSALIKSIADVLQFANPFLLRQLIIHVSAEDAYLWQGISLAFAMFLSAEIRSLCVNYYFIVMSRMGTKMQTMLTAAIYRKSLRLSNSARHERTVGEIMNLMAIDVERFQMITLHIQQAWSSPFQISLALVLLFNTLGIAAVPGVLIMAVIIPLSFISSMATRRWQTKQMQLKDKRSKLCNEILNGIKVIKLYAWEVPMMEAVERIRAKELKCILHAGLVRSVIDTFNFTSPFLVAIGSFSLFYYLNPSELTPQVAFVALTLFNQLRSPMTMIGFLINQFVQTVVSNKRMRHFLVADELDQNAIERIDAMVMDGGGAVASDIAAGRKNGGNNGIASAPDIKIRLVDADFAWENDTTFSSTNNNSPRPPTLQQISMEVRSAQLVAIVGKVGAGKSSLLSAILGDMDKLRGRLQVRHGLSIAYVPQQPWIQNMSLQRNITFGRSLLPELYDQVLDACALKPDLAILPHGDQTEIGEKGINLSGGQKARVALARALYQQSDLFLMDDPLSAVDSHVARWIFDKVIGPHGMLRDRARLLVTHRLRFLQQADQILLLDGGRIAEHGTFQELSALGGKFAKLLAEGELAAEQGEEEGNGNKGRNGGEMAQLAEEPELEQDQEEEEEGGELLPPIATPLGSNEDLTSPEQIDQLLHQNPDLATHHQHLRHRTRSRTVSSSCKSQNSMLAAAGQDDRRPAQQQKAGNLMSGDATADGSANAAKMPPPVPNPPDGKGETAAADDDGKLVEKERVETGRVKMAVYLDYIRAAGLMLPLFFLLFCANQGMQMGRNFWLSAWSDENQQKQQQMEAATNDSGNHQSEKLAEHEADDEPFRLAIYAAFGIAEALFFQLALLCLLYSGLAASRHLHSPMLDRVMHAPMAFFDSTPIGRLLNRFGKDVEVADVVLPINARYFVQCMIMVVATLLTICISTWAVAIVIIPLFVFYLHTLRLYVPASRQMKRLESSHRSPIYSHFGESIQGASSIRAFARQQEFSTQMEARIDELIQIKYLSLVANRWLAVRLEFVGNTVVLFAALFGALSREWNFVASAGLVGLSVSYALNITEVINFAIRQISELETNIVSIERLKEYAVEVQTEAAWKIAGSEPPKEWPNRGQIQFDHYSVRYRPGLELVLRDICAEIRPSERVGIVGRTGAGKSSLTLALFRMIEPTEGSIFIDGLDITTIGLHDLRSTLTIIPQDPVLFSGTLRFNLDPFGAYTDAKIWEALGNSHLRDFARGLADGLDHEISEGGENISVGQRQLLCLARALLRSSRILVLDEATAAVDLSTDALIQETIRQKFRHCTVLTIAHRLETIMDYDRVIVLQHGEIREFDSPQLLMANRSSLFAAMVADAQKQHRL